MENQEKEVVRPLHELYELLYDKIKDREYVGMLCFRINDLLLTSLEYFQIKNHFEEQKPSMFRHTEFYNHECFVDVGTWWSNANDQSTEQRKLFIQKMIEITKPKN